MIKIGKGLPSVIMADAGVILDILDALVKLYGYEPFTCMVSIAKEGTSRISVPGAQEQMEMLDKARNQVEGQYQEPHLGIN